jgi:hypothetical protein
VRRSHACAAAGLTLAAAYWLAADALPRSALADSVGADGVPKLLAFLLAGLSLLIAARPDNTEEPQAKPLKALGVAGLGFVYVAMLPLTGYLVGAGLLAAASALYYGARGRVVLLFSICTALLLWLVFAKALGVALP